MVILMKQFSCFEYRVQLAISTVDTYMWKFVDVDNIKAQKSSKHFADKRNQSIWIMNIKYMFFLRKRDIAHYPDLDTGTPL